MASDQVDLAWVPGAGHVHPMLPVAAELVRRGAEVTVWLPPAFGAAARATGVPVAFGVLTCDTMEQALDRAGGKAGNKGAEAALSALEMAGLLEAIDKQD